MLFCETTRRDRAGAEDLAIFASQLAALGVPARVAVSSIPEKPGRNLQFDLAPHLVDGGLRPGDGLALLAADQLTDDTLVHLRRLAGDVEVTARAFGRFAKPQSALSVRARLAYVFGREPELFDIAGTDARSSTPAPAFGVVRPAARAGGAGAQEPPRLLLVGPDINDPVQAAALSALSLRRSVRTAVLLDSRSKQAWIAERGREVALFHFGETLPLALASRTDICVFCSGIGSSYRLPTLVANLLVSGAALLDGSPDHRIATANDAFIPAPPGILGLHEFLSAEILPNLGRIAEHVRASRAVAAVAAEPVLGFLGGWSPPAVARRQRSAAPPAAGGLVFMPTNGVGLGHAQRCALIARAIPRTRARPVFAAFPSCMPLVKSYGFDVMPLVGRSNLHAQTHEHDLANYLRIRALTSGARTLVFDGTYVFDSVYRTVLETGVRGAWIRRGLWQESQDNSIALDREKAFDRVIVPHEAFEELNTAYSRGDQVFAVGPIVQKLDLSPAAREDMRRGLAERYQRRFDRLAVSLLGAGVAADRGMQIQALCGMFERRRDTLHLVLVWPNAALEPSWFGWRHTRVVRTRHAGVLAAAADLAISAAGYNSYHEALYNRVPTIFVPQTGAFMDDQRARARAARDRGLAQMVEAHELMTLERLVSRHLDEGETEAVRARLAGADLPELGTSRAAQLIEELAYGPGTVEYDPLADRSARRG